MAPKFKIAIKFESGSRDTGDALWGCLLSYPEPSTRYDLHLLTKFEDCSFTRIKDLIKPKNLKMGDLTQTTPILGVICHTKANTI